MLAYLGVAGNGGATARGSVHPPLMLAPFAPAATMPAQMLDEKTLVHVCGTALTNLYACYLESVKNRGVSANGRLGGMHLHRQFLDSADEARLQVLRVAHQFDALEALEDFLPDDPKLHLRQAVA